MFLSFEYVSDGPLSIIFFVLLYIRPFLFLKFSFYWTVVASLVAQMVKRLPTTRETWVQSLGWEDLLEKKMASYSSILAWKIPWMEEPVRLQSMRSLRVRHNCVTSHSGWHERK